MAGDSRTRREDRSAAPAVIRVMWVDKLGRERFASVQSYDISASGMRLSLPEAVEARSFVRLQCAELGIHGTASVRHCEHQGGKYLVGLEFLGGLKWKQPAPVPAPKD